MKNIYHLLFIGILFIGCNSNISNENTTEIGSVLLDESSEMTPLFAGEISNQEIWVRYIQAHNDKNLDIIAEINADDWEGYTADGSVVKGSAAHIEILDNWFKDLFKWLFKCEKIFGFKKLSGYDQQRLYAYLAERYLPFWFKKYSKAKELNWVFFDPLKK